jgi:transcriptional regulator with GAF, ATPase, and Fis domain
VTKQRLGQILSKRGQVAAIVSEIKTVTNTPAAVWDVEGNLLLGAVGADAADRLKQYPIICDEEIVGWTSGGEPAELVAALLSYLVTREAEKDELLDEILDLYRQVNLLFNLSEKLAASLELETVARTALQEASRLIEATGSAVVLLNEEQATQPVATLGHGIADQIQFEPGGGILGAVVANARPEIVNDVPLDTRYAPGLDSMHSLICAPLTSKNRALGAIVLVSQVPVTYTAADLKLLTTLASQAVPAIENALLHEAALRQAREREERLRRQVQELRIELDEARQKEQVAEITGSEYYQRLRDRADALRNIIGGQGAP